MNKIIISGSALLIVSALIVPASIGESGGSRKFSSQFNAGPYYNGPLFDAHFHMPLSFKYGGPGFKFPMLEKDVTLDQILSFFDNENVEGAIAFYIPDQFRLEKALQDAYYIKERSFNSIRLFLMPGYLDAEKLDAIQNSNKGLFDGYGELAFYAPEQAGSTPDDDKYLKIYNVAGKHNLVVMIHPDLNQEANLEKAFQSNPDVTFLLHGHEIENSITALINKYPNVYFSIDSAVLYHMNGVFMFGPREKFISRFKEDFNSILNSRVNTWKRQIESYPDRFMWGSDRGVTWHFDEEISILFEEFARAFIGKLDKEVQEKFAYKNAESLFQK